MLTTTQTLSALASLGSEAVTFRLDPGVYRREWVDIAVVEFEPLGIRFQSDSGTGWVVSTPASGNARELVGRLLNRLLELAVKRPAVSPT